VAAEVAAASRGLAAAGASPGRADGVTAVRLAGRAWLWGTVAVTLAAIVTAIVLAPPGSAPVGQGLAYLLFAGSSAHVASTAWFYTVPQVRTHMRQHRARYAGAPIALIAGTGAIVAVLSPVAMEWLLLPYFAWQFFHYQKQNLGLASLAASAHRVAGLRPAERRALLGAGFAGIAGLLAHPRLLQLPAGLGRSGLGRSGLGRSGPAGLPGLAAVYPVALAAFAVAVVAGLTCLARRPADQRPAGLCAAYLSSLGFSLPVFVFSSPYAAVAGMTIAHGLQYLLLVGLVAAGGERSSGRRLEYGPLLQVTALANIALAGGAILAVCSDLHEAQPLVRLLYGGFLGAVMAHFVVDAGLWRLRDQFPRAFLAARVPYLVPAARPVPDGGPD
jgi:hypothetical protein